MTQQEIAPGSIVDSRWDTFVPVDCEINAVEYCTETDTPRLSLYVHEKRQRASREDV
jgi:hypothetical protein